jgi:hypothetical protein
MDVGGRGGYDRDELGVGDIGCSALKEVTE